MQRSPRRPGRRQVSSRLTLAIFILVALFGSGLWLQREQGRTGPVRDLPMVAVQSGTPDPASPGPVAGGSYTEGELVRPATLNPLLAVGESERDLRAVLFAGLTRVGGDGRASPDLAEGWSVSDDGTQYSFRLRQGAVWHDGQPVTSQDVRFTVGLVQDADFPGDGSLARFWRGVVVETPDAGTVIFRLRESFAAFPTYATLPILPRHLLGGVLARDLAAAPFNDAPVGTGPFAFESFDRAAGLLTLRASDSYFGDKPHLSTMRFRFFDDPAKLMDAIKTGEVLGTGALPAGTILQPGAVGTHVSAYAPLLSGYTALLFNLRGPLFANVDVRRALDLAVDRGALVSAVLPDQAVAGNDPIPESSWAFRRQPLRHDPAAAERLLASLGWADHDGDGVLDNAGVNFSFPLLVNREDAQRVAVATALARQLAALKVRAVVTAVPAAEVELALANRQFIAAVYGWRSPTGDPDAFQLWDSSQADDGLNVSGVRNPKLDSLLEKGRRTVDEAARADLYAQFQAAFAQDVPALVLYYPRYFYLMNNAIHGAQASPLIAPSDRFAYVSNWFFTSSTPAAP